MPDFLVHVVTPDGKKVKIVREAPAQQDLVDNLLIKGYSIISVTETSPSTYKVERLSSNVKDLFKKKNYYQDLAIATKQISTLLGAGITLVNSFHILINSAERNYPLREPFLALYNGLSEGRRPDKVMEEFPHVFSVHYRGLVALGLSTGTLKEAFDSLADDMEKEITIRKKVIAAITYPLFTFATAFLLNLALFIFVLPKIVGIISELDVTLPLITRVLMTVMDYVCNPYFVVLTVLIAGFIFYQFTNYIQTPVGKYNYDHIKLRLPLFGHINRTVYSERFCRSLGLLLKYNVPVQEAIFITGKICSNSFMEQKLIYPLMDAVEQGEFLTEALNATRLLPSSAVQMIAAGEATGDIGACLKDASNLFEMELSSSLQKLITMIEPIMIVLMSVFVLSIMMAIMLPLYQVIQQFGT